jgi:hypothetical protein
VARQKNKFLFDFFLIFYDICALNKNYMKKKFLELALITLLLFAGKAIAQDSIPSVEKSIMGIQVGESGLVFNYELRLAEKFALRTEAGYNVFIFSGDEDWIIGENNKNSVAALPTFTIEPRWYYNLGRRVRKGKDIMRNRANYVSLFVNYSGGWGAIRFDDRIDQMPDIFYITPMWGMRRTLGKHLNYELGAGVGYFYNTQYKHFDHSHRSDEGAMLFIRARFGFDF